MNINLGNFLLRCYPRVGLVPSSFNGFKSAISLDKLYPNSSLDISKEVQVSLVSQAQYEDIGLHCTSIFPAEWCVIYNLKGSQMLSLKNCLLSVCLL